MTIHVPETLIRNWGEEIVFAFTTTHAGKVLRRRAGTKGGYQVHLKEESHYVLEGALRLRWLDSDGQEQTRRVSAGEAWTVPPGVCHQEEACEDSVILEVGDPTREDRYALEPDPGGLPSMSDDQAVTILQRLGEAFRERALDAEAWITHIRRRGLAGLIPTAKP